MRARRPGRSLPKRDRFKRTEDLMPRYVVERTFNIDEDAMPDLGRRSKQIVLEHFPEIVWEHSHVVIADDGTLKSFCIYVAPDAATVRRHAEMLGDHVVEHVYEIGSDITPDDFPLPEGIQAINADADHVHGGGV